MSTLLWYLVPQHIKMMHTTMFSTSSSYYTKKILTLLFLGPCYKQHSNSWLQQYMHT